MATAPVSPAWSERRSAINHAGRPVVDPAAVAGRPEPAGTGSEAFVVADCATAVLDMIRLREIQASPSEASRSYSIM